MLIIKHTSLFFFISFCSHASNSSLNDLDSFKISVMSVVTMESVLVPRDLEVIVLVNVFVAVVVAVTADVAASVVVIVVVGIFPLLRGVAADVRAVLVIFKAEFLLVPKIFRFGYNINHHYCSIIRNSKNPKLYMKQKLNSKREKNLKESFFICFVL